MSEPRERSPGCTFGKGDFLHRPIKGEIQKVANAPKTPSVASPSFGRCFLRPRTPGASTASVDALRWPFRVRHVLGGRRFTQTHKGESQKRPSGTLDGAGAIEFLEFLESIRRSRPMTERVRGLRRGGRAVRASIIGAGPSRPPGFPVRYGHAERPGRARAPEGVPTASGGPRRAYGRLRPGRRARRRPHPPGGG